jgi:hypothetical protein
MIKRHLIFCVLDDVTTKMLDYSNILCSYNDAERISMPVAMYSLRLKI